MNYKNTLLAGLAVALLAGPALAANPELSPTVPPQEADVTTSVEAGCAIESSLTAFEVSVEMDGAITGPGAQANAVTVTCNIPTAAVMIGSDDMKNPAAIDPTEADTFSNTIAFRADAASDNGWGLDSRDTNSWYDIAPLSWSAGTGGEHRRIRTLSVSVNDLKIPEGTLPVAGTYTGTICITVDPGAGLGLESGGNGNRFCTESPT